MDFVMTAFSPWSQIGISKYGRGRNMGGLGGRGGAAAHLGLRLIGPLRAPAQQACTHPITQLR